MVPPEDRQPDLASVLAEVVLPALRAVLHPHEPDHLDLGRSEGGDHLLTLQVGDDVFRDAVVQSGVPGVPHDAWCERLTSNLVDWVAESGFGWGQDRSRGLS